MPRRLNAGALALVSGVLLALCLPRPGLCALAWIGLAPLFYALSKRPLRQSFRLGWLAGFAFQGTAYYWIYSTCRFAKVPSPDAPILVQVVESLIAWGALAAFQGLAWGLAAVIGRWAAQALPQKTRALGWAVVWTATFVALERWTPRFPGDLLEYTQWRFLSLLQIASIAGPHALGFIIAFFNAALAQAWDESQGGRVPAASATPGLALASAFAAAAWVYGAACFDGRPAPAHFASVEILQPNIDQYQKWDESYGQRIMGGFDELLARPRAVSPALIVWPESALPRWVSEDEAPLEAAGWSHRLKTQQVIGVVSRDEKTDLRFNAAFLLDSEGALVGKYHKRELVPFGEYVPLPWLGRYVGILNEMGGITAGARAQPLLKTPVGEASVSICYEILFPRLVRFDASLGARVLISITNDGWYKDTWGPYQDFTANIFRAVENRMTVIRSGNTGISGVIDPWGRVLAKLDLNKRGRLDVSVPLDESFPNGSFYARHGDWFATLMLVLAALMLAAAPGLNYGRGGFVK